MYSSALYFFECYCECDFWLKLMVRLLIGSRQKYDFCDHLTMTGFVIFFGQKKKKSDRCNKSPVEIQFSGNSTTLASSTLEFSQYWDSFPGVVCSELTGPKSWATAGDRRNGCQDKQQKRQTI